MEEIAAEAGEQAGQDEEDAGTPAGAAADDRPGTAATPVPGHSRALFATPTPTRKARRSLDNMSISDHDVVDDPQEVIALRTWS